MLLAVLIAFSFSLSLATHGSSASNPLLSISTNTFPAWLAQGKSSSTLASSRQAASTAAAARHGGLRAAGAMGTWTARKWSTLPSLAWKMGARWSSTQCGDPSRR
uniref:Secreted protein n=1 Tax=Arundo donax TaxID=35708 RepID=A0A0A9D793_ARUDO